MCARQRNQSVGDQSASLIAVFLMLNLINSRDQKVWKRQMQARCLRAKKGCRRDACTTRIA